MVKYMRQSLDFLLFSNIFIAVCAVAQGLVTYQLLGARPDEHVLAILFCATLSLYNFSIFLSKPRDPAASPFRRVRWIFSHYRLMITITLISILSVIPLFLFLSMTAKLLLVFLAAVSVAYNMPVFTVNDKKFSLRNIPGIKLFLIALVWSLSAVMLPILELESHHSVVPARDTILLVAKRFLLVAAITVPFDIRDLFQDKLYELKTIPVLLGERRAYLFCQFLLAAYVAMLFLFTRDFGSNFLALTLTVVLAGWLIFKSDLKKNEYYYFLGIDGILLLQFLLLSLAAAFR